MKKWFDTGVPYDRLVVSSSGWLKLFAGAISEPYDHVHVIFLAAFRKVGVWDLLG